MRNGISDEKDGKGFSFSLGRNIYGIRAEKEGSDVQYTAYLYEFYPEENIYVYGMAIKRWKTLGVALMKYAVRGIFCFPIYGEKPETLTEKEILDRIDRGFDEMLEQERKT